jgi:dipeptidyl aminopeptidase/acylaminoacyl peptidase
MGLSDQRILCFAAILLLAASAYGSEPQRLTTDGRLKFSPVFINAGELAYTDFADPTLYRLQRLKLEDRSIEPLHPDAKTSELELTFSRDGKFCAFVQTKGVLSLSVVIRNCRTKKDAVVPPAPGFAGMRSPAIAPDNARVVYSFAEGGLQHLYSVDIQAGNQKVLTSEGINNWPCFSPNGKQITFSSTRHGNYEIYVMKADGSEVRRLTDSPLQDIRPRFSPDGKRIAFTSHRDGNHELYVMNADGSSVRRLTDHPERDDYPAWSPAGGRIAFVAERAGRHDIYLLEVAE